MRAVSRRVCTAFLNRKPASVKNTRTDGAALYLYGNKIAWWEDGTLYLTMAGYGTRTTRERLNALCELLIGWRPFFQHGGFQLYRLRCGAVSGWHADAVLPARELLRA